MKKMIGIVAISALLAISAVYAGGASATGFFSKAPQVATVSLPTEVAGDCVVQTRWVSDRGQMREVERAVCY